MGPDSRSRLGPSATARACRRRRADRRRRHRRFRSLPNADQTTASSHVAVAPGLAGFHRRDDRVRLGGRVRAHVPHRRRVAAQHPPAHEALSQVHPVRALGHAGRALGAVLVGCAVGIGRAIVSRWGHPSLIDRFSGRALVGVVVLSQCRATGPRTLARSDRLGARRARRPLSTAGCPPGTPPTSPTPAAPRRRRPSAARRRRACRPARPRPSTRASVSRIDDTLRRPPPALVERRRRRRVRTGPSGVAPHGQVGAHVQPSRGERRRDRKGP